MCLTKTEVERGPQNTTFSVRLVSSLPVLAWTTLDHPHVLALSLSAGPGWDWLQYLMNILPSALLSSAPTALDRGEVQIMILYSSAHRLLT